MPDTGEPQTWLRWGSVMGFCEQDNEHSGSTEDLEFLDDLSDCQGEFCSKVLVRWLVC
jgi:hypothetical protein